MEIWRNHWGLTLWGLDAEALHFGGLESIWGLRSEGLHFWALESPATASGSGRPLTCRGVYILGISVLWVEGLELLILELVDLAPVWGSTS